MAQFEEFMKRVESASFGEAAHAILIYTDQLVVLKLSELKEACADPEKKPEEKLLDIRVFDEKRELRIYRDYIGHEFGDPIELNDDETAGGEGLSEEGYQYDDEQFLDKKSYDKGSGRIQATGGGYYRFPASESGKTKVKIRNYVRYDDNGQAYIYAWRVVGFL